MLFIKNCDWKEDIHKKKYNVTSYEFIGEVLIIIFL
jgi:hypothetical protein